LRASFLLALILLIEEIEKAMQNKDVTFSSFVIQACEYALRDMDK